MREPNRRIFLKEIGIAVLTVQCLPLMAHASEHLLLSQQTGHDLTIRSGPGLMSHVHDLLIPYGVLTAPPPQGIQLQTTQALLHRHSIALSRDQLIVVGRGGTVTMKASSHLFVIALAKG